jgi:nicotinate-nucleotide adenylyltransferase
MNEREKTETILYGGAFNPPTLAHVQILQACVDYARPRGADVWVMPSGNRLDKVIPVTRERRLAYVAAMLEDIDSHDVSVGVTTLELDREVPVETYDTAVELAALYPDRTMTWVFGADSTETMGSWKQGDWLLEHLDKLVIEREGSAINPMAQRTVALSVATPNVSSTEVRRRIECHESVAELVSGRVAALLGPV